MIGNDLVWLGDPANHASFADPRYGKRVLASSEWASWQENGASERWLWSLWSAKEAAFKAWARFDQTLRFHPREWVVDVEPGLQPRKGVVEHGKTTIPVTWTQARTWVHAVVASEPARFAVGRWKGSPSEGTRRWAARRVSVWNRSTGTVTGTPPVFVSSRPAEILSLSHDGPWCAVAAQKS